MMAKTSLGAYLLCAFASTLLLRAQDPAPYTLHVYANLVQVETLVLTPRLAPVPSIPLHDFEISLDGGPTFPASKLHPETNDPLQLAIFLDDSGSVQSMLDRFADDFSSLALAYLHPEDALTLFAADCNVIGSSAPIPIAQRSLHDAVAGVLAVPSLHDGRKHSSCGGKIRLYDDIAVALQHLATLPGRRVLLLVSSGEDHASKNQWPALMRFAQLHDIAIFGLEDAYNLPSNLTTHTLIGSAAAFTQMGELPAEQFSALCASTGGILLATDSTQQSSDLKRIFTMIRSRYIIEFPRANDLRSGMHNIVVDVRHQPTLIVRTTGVSMTPLDPRLLADPSTVPTKPSQATFGNHPPHSQ